MIQLAEALKVDQLCHRILSDIGSIHARINIQADGTVNPMSPELIALRKHIREISDSMRDSYPDAFFR